MKLNLHIERVVLEELPLGVPERRLFRSAVLNELTRLLREASPATDFTGGAVPDVRAPGVRFGADASPQQIGVAVAGAVHRSLCPSESQRSMSNSRAPSAGSPRSGVGDDPQ